MKSQRELAQQAFREVRHAVEKRYSDDREERDRFRAYCMKVPSMIQRFGVPQTLAFLKSREGKFPAAEHYISALERVTGRNDLLKSSIHADMLQYFAETQQALQASAWLRRFAQAELPPPDKNQAEPEA